MLKPNQKSKSPKKIQVEKMFDSISSEYDLLNGIMTFNSHKKWKKNILNIAKKLKPKNALDIATGTADIAINLGSIYDCKVVGVDISEHMPTLDTMQQPGFDAEAHNRAMQEIQNK